MGRQVKENRDWPVEDAGKTFDEQAIGEKVSKLRQLAEQESNKIIAKAYQ